MLSVLSAVSETVALTWSPLGLEVPMPTLPPGTTWTASWPEAAGARRISVSARQQGKSWCLFLIFAPLCNDPAFALLDSYGDQVR
jgi:hypothetical protein